MQLSALTKRGKVSQAQEAASLKLYVLGRLAPLTLSMQYVFFFGCLSACIANAQDVGINPTRPTIANSAGMQNKSVLQVEVGLDSFPQRVPGNEQTLGSLLSYVPLDRLRLDFGWSPYAYQHADGNSAQGVGTIQAGGKVELWKEDYHRPAPGIAVQYEAEFPTASTAKLQNLGQQFIVLLNHHYGRNGIFDIIVNGSLVQSDCQTVTGCTYGGQQSLALSYHLHENTRLYTEVFGQNKSESNAPPGTYVFEGFYQKLNQSFGVDGGLRFGVSDRSASVGFTAGLVFGKRLHGRHKG